MSKQSDAIGPQGETESNLDYNLRYKAFLRKERKRRREQVEAPDEAEAAEPEEDSVESDVRDAWTRSERELEKMGE